MPASRESVPFYDWVDCHLASQGSDLWPWPCEGNAVARRPLVKSPPTGCYCQTTFLPSSSPQGLRSCTQVAGCLVSLSMLSPRLTLLLMVATPTLMGVGTLMGSALRKLSRQCQEQVPAFLPVLLTCPISLCSAIPPQLRPRSLLPGLPAGRQGNGRSG